MAEPPCEQEHEGARHAREAGGDKGELSTKIAVVLHHHSSFTSSIINHWFVFVCVPFVVQWGWVGGGWGRREGEEAGEEQGEEVGT